MKEINFDTRTTLARECIARVCSAAGLSLMQRLLNVRSLLPNLNSMLDENVNLVNGGTKVLLSITSRHLTMINTESNLRIFQHDLNNVSFTLAYAIDQDQNQQHKKVPDSKYAAYVVNDPVMGRICMVMDCEEQATEVAMTINQAFDVHYRLNLPKVAESTDLASIPTNQNVNVKESPTSTTIIPVGASTCSKQLTSTPTLVSSTPLHPRDNNAISEMNKFSSMPLMQPTQPVPTTSTRISTPITSTEFKHRANSITTTIIRANQFIPNNNSPVASSTHELQTDPPYYNDMPNKTPPVAAPPLIKGMHHKTVGNSTKSLAPFPTPDPWSRLSSDEQLSTIDEGSDTTDTFVRHDVPENNNLNGILGANVATPRPITRSVAFSNLTRMSYPDSQLNMESWFHGAISREQAEPLLFFNGDFLVRITQNHNNTIQSPGASNYVISTRQNGQFRHVLLEKRNGQICGSNEMLFQSISHLVNFHLVNNCPLQSIRGGELIWLQTPIAR